MSRAICGNRPHEPPEDGRMTPMVCIVGKRNSGKTSLTVELAAELDRRGYVVMTIKHGHGFDLDREGSDSWRHRHEGRARRVLVAGPGEFALMGDWPASPAVGDPRELADRYLSDADVVLAEGFHATAGVAKIEVIARDGEEAPWYDPAAPDGAGAPFAIATDCDALEAAVPVFGLGVPGAIGRIADWVEASITYTRCAWLSRSLSLNDGAEGARNDASLPGHS
jgi:molybdopterin-guanine dinucleotide biosynthesis protein B